ncbi:DUF456 domain-containing protein [Robertmurraya mangrovi]|nr:DUF456 domain-containing protein [Bacillus sp. 31A1R]
MLGVFELAESLYWGIIIILFIISFIGLVYPIIPSVLFIFAAFILYGFLFTFEPFNWLFWLIQSLFLILLFGADYVANMIGVKKYGGSKAGIWGSTIGLLVGPFIIPLFGIIIGPFIGAIIAELIVNKKDFKDAVKIGFGSVVGFISSVITKGIIQGVMIGYFLLVVL